MQSITHFRNMNNYRMMYEYWFKELESNLVREGITYLPSHFYAIIKFYYDNGYSAGFTCQVIKLHMTILEQQTTR